MALTFGAPWPWTQEVAKTTNYTVVAGDTANLFTTTGAGGAVTFTLPTLAAGLVYWFWNTVNQNMAITAPAANTLVADGNATGTTATYSTASHKIGSFGMAWANQAATLWYFFNMGGTVVTIT